MSVAAARIDHERRGPHAGGEPDCIHRVGQALTIAMPTTAGETARPKQIGDRQAALGQKLDSFFFAIVGEFLAPDANGANASGAIMADILVERPTVGRHFVDGETRHPSCLSLEFKGQTRNFAAAGRNLRQAGRGSIAGNSQRSQPCLRRNCHWSAATAQRSVIAPRAKPETRPLVS